jgi:hypothetical protein
MKKFQDFKANNKVIGDLVEFCEARRDGAEKIAKKAEAKGGFSMLTAWHFFAKLPEYNDAIVHIKHNDIKSFLDKKFKEFGVKINPSTNTQKEFQELMGKMEVIGEIRCKFHELTEK